MNQMSAVDFFCGGGGMTRGLLDAGVNVIAGLDIDKKCKETYEINNSPSKFIETDIKNLPENYLESELSVNRFDNNMIFIGCSPCQYWSIIRSDKTKSAQTRNLLEDFQRFVDYYRPGYIVIENVPGLASETKNTPLKKFKEFLKSAGYEYLVEKTVNASLHGVPQTRRRFLMIASRINSVNLPKKLDNIPTVKEFINDLPPIQAGHKDNSTLNHSVAGLSEKCLQRLYKTPADGGTRLAYEGDPELELPTYRRMREDGRKGFNDSYSRLRWEKPAATITTKFFSISNGRFAHPEQHRALSMREGARLQTFNDDYIFKTTSIADTARLIGNAVPPKLARLIGETIIESTQNNNIQNAIQN